jgi:hypothetical protein
MSSWFVKANDIKNWTATNKRRAEETLPLLIKRLILASCRPKSIGFPSGDSISLSGWDGIVEVDQGNEFVPTGKSGWECGTDEGANSKADNDFATRANRPDPLALTDTTFVFATSRTWRDKSKWVFQKKGLGQWKDVHGINADDLELWLERCPAVHRWFATLIGKRSGNLWDIDQAWGSLSCVTKHNLTSDFFLNSRQKARDGLLNKMADQAQIFRIKAPSRLDSHGFILCCLKSEESCAARSLIVKDQSAWDEMIDCDNSLILVPEGFIPQSIGRALANGHHVILPVDHFDSYEAFISLDSMPRHDRIAAIQSLGVSEGDATQIYVQTKGDLEKVLRHPRLIPQDKIEPQWATNPPCDVLLAALAATGWDTTNENDKKALAILSGMPYEEFEAKITELSITYDPPVRLIGDVHEVISKTDLWSFLGRHLSKAYLNRLEEVTDLVLSDLDPAFDLPPTKRLSAIFKGAVPQFSERLKTGVADTLAMLAAHGDEFQSRVGTVTPSTLVICWVKRLFGKGLEGRIWCSLGRRLQSIAEAAPEVFLEAVREASAGSEPHILGLFKAEGDGILSGCPHSDLLWALELVAWNPSHFTEVCRCLARLAQIDPGGKISHRPLDLLTKIFLGLVNNTHVTYEERMQILQEILIPEFSDIAWRIMIQLLKPNWAMEPCKPVYRDWADNVDLPVNPLDIHDFRRLIVSVLVDELHNGGSSRVLDIMNVLEGCTGTEKLTIADRLLAIDVDKMDQTVRDQVANKLRNLISLYREYPNEGISWPAPMLDMFEAVYHHFESDDPIRANAYLFDVSWPHFLNSDQSKREDYKERISFIRNKRIEAIEQIHTDFGMEGLRQLTEYCNSPRHLGLTLAQSSFSDQNCPQILDWLETGGKLTWACQSFIEEKSHKSPDWASTTLRANEGWSTARKLSFLVSVPVGLKTIEVIESQDLEVQRKYWQEYSNYFYCDDYERVMSYVAVGLLDHDRPLAALRVMGPLFLGGYRAQRISSKLVGAILLRIAHNPSDADRVPIQAVQDDILRAIKFVQDQSELPAAEIAAIELFYLGIFRFDREIRPLYLFSQLASDPSFFVKMVRWYADKAIPGIADKDILRVIAETAWEILNTASVLPGSNGSEIESRELGAWIDEARKELAEVGLQEIGDRLIGSYLSHCSAGSDGIWPHEAVRGVIEKTRSHELENGMKIGRYNSRGVTTRGLFEGGKQERTLASRYREDAKKIEILCSRTAKLLRRLANEYEDEARGEDRRVDLLE